jgi:hypothetical protein
MIDGEHSAVVALHCLSLPERNSGVVVEDNPVSALMRQAVVFIERWNAELNERDDGATPRPTESVAPAAVEQATPTLQDDDAGLVVISLCFDTKVVTRIDAAAKHLGISRAGWCTLRSESAWTGDDPMLRTVEHRTRVRVAPFRLPRQRA